MLSRLGSWKVLVLAVLLGGGVWVPISPAAADSDTISGTVSVEGGGAAYRLYVNFYRPDPDGGWEWVGFTATDTQGKYSTSLPHAPYRVEFDPFSQQNLTGYHGGTSLETATTIDNSSGPLTGIDGTVPKAGKITGTVPQFANGGGNISVLVESSPGTWTEAGHAVSHDSDAGKYTVYGLPTGSYQVQFLPSGAYLPEYYDDSPDLAGADSVAVTAGSETAGIDATLAPGTSYGLGHITGHVVRANGAPAKYTWVYAYARRGSDWVRLKNFWVIQADGRYNVTVPAGQYRIRFVDSGGAVATEFWRNASNVTGASSISVLAGKTSAGHNAVLERPGGVSGTITLPNKDGDFHFDADRDVEVVDIATGEVVPAFSIYARAGKHSFKWALKGLGPGTYRVQFARTPGVAEDEAQFYSGKRESLGSSSAAVITLGVGEWRTGVNATLRVGGTITGYVLRTDGSSSTGCTVYAYSPTGSFVTRQAKVGADGRFRMTGLTTGAYRLKITAGQYGISRHRCLTDRYYAGGAGALSDDEADATTVHVTATRDTLLPTTLYYTAGAAPSLPDIQNAGQPGIAGNAKVGQTLDATAGTWSPTPLQVRYQWLRDGVALAGRVSSFYTLGTADRGHKISVRITAYAVGHDPGVAFSASTATVG